MSDAALGTSVRDIINDHFTFSMEFFPPRTPERKESFDKHLAQLLEIDIDFCSITYGAGGTTTELTPEYVVSLAQRFSVPAIAHLTCIEHTRESLDRELNIFDECGIKNILALRGDPRSGGSEQHEIPYAFDLLNILRDRNEYCIGVAAHPEGHIDSGEIDIEFQAEKISHADYAITQLFYDIDRYKQFLDQLGTRGVVTPVIPGVLPLTDIQRVEKIIQMSGTTIPQVVLEKLNAYEPGSESQREAGLDFTSEMCQQLKDCGAPGLHIYTMNRADSVKAIFERLHK